MMHAFNSDAVYQQLFRSHWLAEWAQYNSSQYYAGDDGRYGLGAGPVKRSCAGGVGYAADLFRPFSGPVCPTCKTGDSCRMFSPSSVAGYMPANPEVIKPQLLSLLAAGETVYPLPNSGEYVLWRKSLLYPGWTSDPPDTYTGVTTVDVSSELFGLSTLWLGADFYKNFTDHWPQSNTLKSDDAESFRAAAAAEAGPHTRPVDRYSASWAQPASPDVPNELQRNLPTFPDGPFAGNGDVSLILVGNGTTSHKKHAAKVADWQQWTFLSKNDMWGSDSKDRYPHLSAGRVGFAITPPRVDNVVNASVHMFPGNASIVHTLTDPAGDASVSATTRVLENNVVVTDLVCTSRLGGDCSTVLLLSDTNDNHYGVDQSVGASPAGDLVWWRKENLHAAFNPTYVGSCDPYTPLQSTERRFTVGAGGDLRMVNGSCLWFDESAAPDLITSGACAQPQGGWKWMGDTSNGDIVHTASSKCLSTHRLGQLTLGSCGSMPWSQVPSGSTNASHVFLSTGNSSGTGGCLVVVPDNNNNTLGVSLGIVDAEGSLVHGDTARLNETQASAGISLSVSLKSAARYTLVVALQTLRDMGCAGIRPQWEACTSRPEDAAASLVRAMAPASERGAAVARSDAFWDGFWSRSSVDIAGTGERANASRTVERWYYLAQYLLGCTTRDGKVTAALDGFVCVEPVPWQDQFTLDYNLESTFWGAGSSNRIEFIHPVMASTTNPGAVATARLRAQNKGTWDRHPHWPGRVGSTVPGAECDPECPNLTATGFRGAEWPAAAMPLGDGRLANSDLQSRFSGGLLATNLIQYWEYTQNLTTLRELIYPFVKDNAEFYICSEKS